MINHFEDLLVWQKGHRFVLEVYKVSKDFPTEEKFGLVSQIRRSSASICANIAEGHKKSTKDYVRFLDIAQGSLQETKYHLILSKDLGYITEDQFIKLKELTNEIGRMLNGLSSNLRS